MCEHVPSPRTNQSLYETQQCFLQKYLEITESIYHQQF